MDLRRMFFRIRKISEQVITSPEDLAKPTIRKGCNSNYPRLASRITELKKGNREVLLMRTKFDEQLELLNTELIEMGLLIENAIQSTSLALLHKNIEEAEKTIAFEVEINEKERSIENLCLKLLLQQQPVAKDLRFISAALKMITDMERIGDQARDISEIIVYLTDEPYIKKIEHLPMMAAETIKMVHKSIDAFVKRDLALALEVMEMD